MPSRTLPGLGLTAGWNGGEDGWGGPLTTNFLMLSTLCQLVAEDIVETLPLTPADGEIYLIAATALSNPGMIAARDDGIWRMIQPVMGWEAWVKAQSGRYRFTGAGWTGVASAAQIPPFGEVNAGYVLAVNPLGAGVMWVPAYSPVAEIPVWVSADEGKQLTLVPDPDPESETGLMMGWQAPALELPAIPANSRGKVVTVTDDGRNVQYEEDGRYKAVAPGYVVTNDDMSGRVILGASGNVVIPSGLTRTSTLTIARMSTTEVAVTAGPGVTLAVADNRYNLRAHYSSVSIIRTGVNQYLMVGDVALA